MVNCLIYLCIITKTGGQRKTTRLKGKNKMEKIQGVCLNATQNLEIITTNMLNKLIINYNYSFNN